MDSTQERANLTDNTNSLKASFYISLMVNTNTKYQLFLSIYCDLIT